MSQCWPLEGMSIAQKAVLISLADNANDQGVCWPSIPTIARRVCASDRAVQNAIKWLESARLVTANRANGRHTSYTVTPAAYAPPKEMHQRTKFTGAGDSPAQEMHHTPAGDSGGPRTACTIPPNHVPSNRNEPSVNRQGTANSTGDAGASVSGDPGNVVGDGDEKPLGLKDLIAEGVDRQVGRDWLAVRKAKKSILTPTAWAAVKREAERAGITPGEAVAHAAVAGWAGFKAAWLDNAAGRVGQSASSGNGGGLNKQEQLEQRNREIAAAQAARVMAGERA